VQNKLELLKEVILPNQDFKVAQPMERYNGNREQCKNPIVSQLSGNVCSVRLGGNGVAIGSLIGTELADLIWRQKIIQETYENQ
jgi:hypothetical protein